MQHIENLELFKLVEADEVARLVAVTRHGLLRHARGTRPLAALNGFPPPVRRGRGQEVLWLLADVIAWLKSKSTLPTQHSPASRRGRPRKGVVV